MDRNKKIQAVEFLKSSLNEAELVVLTHQTGLTVDESLDLRRKMRASKAHLKVAKNTLISLAIKDTPYASLKDHLKGPTVLGYSQDPIAAAKVLIEFAEKNTKLNVLCAVMNGNFLSQSDVKALATLPSLDELKSKLIAVLQAPATKVAGVLQAPAGQLARVFSAYSKINN